MGEWSGLMEPWSTVVQAGISTGKFNIQRSNSYGFPFQTCLLPKEIPPHDLQLF